MAQQVSKNEILEELNAVLGCQHIKLSNITFCMSEMLPFPEYNNYAPIDFYTTPKTLEIDLYFEIPLNRVVLTREDLLITLEDRITHFLKEVNGEYLHRSMVPFDEDHIATINYTVKLHDYSTFTTKLNHLARSKFDREFSNLLEKALTS